MQVTRRRSRLQQSFTVMEIPLGSIGVLFENGVFQQVLHPGQYSFWNSKNSIDVIEKSTQIQFLSLESKGLRCVDGIEIDLSVVIKYSITDVRVVVEALEDETATVHQEVEESLQSVIGRYILDDLLEERVEIAENVTRQVAQRVRSYGITIEAIDIRDIGFPDSAISLFDTARERCVS